MEEQNLNNQNSSVNATQSTKMNESLFSGGTKVTFNSQGVYSSGPRASQNQNGNFIKDSKVYKKVDAMESHKKSFLFSFIGAILGFLLVLILFGIFGGFGKNVMLGSTGSTQIFNSDESETLAEAVAEKCLPSVVGVKTYQNAKGTLALAAQGSGVILSSDGYIITNQHVIGSADQIKVTSGGQEYEADKIGEDSSSDIAVLKAKNVNNLTAFELADSDNAKAGQWVMSIGSPFGLEQSVATGIISATSRSEVVPDQNSGSTKVYPNLLQTDAAINPGNSGGALVDKNGRLIGINALIESTSGNYSGVGFAIPINYAVTLSKQIIDGKNPSHAQLGITMTNVNETNAKQYGWSVSEGAYVSGVTAGSAAEKAGMKVGDIITKCDGEKVSTTSDVLLQVRKHNPGDTISITFNRAGEEITVNATLGSDEGQAQQQQQQQQQKNQNNNNNSRGNNSQDLEDLFRKFFGY